MVRREGIPACWDGYADRAGKVACDNGVGAAEYNRVNRRDVDGERIEELEEPRTLRQAQ